MILQTNQSIQLRDRTIRAQLSMILIALIFREIQVMMFTNKYSTPVTSSTYSLAVQGREITGQTVRGFMGELLSLSTMAALLVKEQLDPPHLLEVLT